MAMSLIDVNSLLEEISAELPCGEDLEYDPEFGEMERAAQGKPEQQIGSTLIPAQEADWPVVKSKAIALFGRTKDLRAAVYLTRSLLHTQGLIGLRDGLSVIQGLVERYWEMVHPQLDPADNNDPTLRINTLTSLCDPDTVLHSIREATLVNSTALGRFSLRDILISLGKLSLPAGSDEQVIEVSTINAAFMDAQLDDLQITADAIRQSLESIAAIESTLMDMVGSMQMADFSTLPNLLKEAQHIMSEHLTQRGVGGGVAEAAASSEAINEVPGSQISAQPMTGAINSQEDVIRVLDMACEYFKQHEPSSPVPLLLQRAKRLVAKDFMEILRDLTPAGVTQAEEISGVSHQK
jgi:type VI secretion system protein ImpA